MKKKTYIIAGAALAAAGAGAAAVAVMKKNKFCPRCYVKRKVDNYKARKEGTTEKYGNGAGLTPIMGWSSWNAFREKIDENLIREIAAAMKEAGLVDAGYVYLNLDDCWHSSLRDGDGRLQGDLTNFPSGIPQLVEDVNAMGMKLGLYSSNGTLTCEDLPASLGHEAVDAQTLAEWGVEFFKYDFCHNVPLPKEAPEIEKITVGKPGSADVLTFLAKDAGLGGVARILPDEKLPTGEYITGLNANNGFADFTNVEVPEAGTYILTICLKKSGEKDKYIEALVNGRDSYGTIVPGTKSWSPTGRHQIEIQLDQGVNTIRLSNPIANNIDSAARQYTNMGLELKKATARVAAETGQPEKPIVFSICEWGFRKPWLWGAKAGNMWRTTGDICAKWESILAIYERTVRLNRYAGPGGFNDPDMLEVGNGKLTYEENKAHFTLWCMMAAPLVLGNDIRKLRGPDGSIDRENKVLQIITNRDLIAVDQDPLGIQCFRYRSNGVSDVLVKPLAGDEIAVCFFNKSSKEKTMAESIRAIAGRMEVRLPQEGYYQVFDLWDKTISTIEDTLSVQVPGHGVRVFRISRAGARA